MLNGIGGTTVAEAKERVSYAEALAWSQYMRRYGSLHLGRRMELGFAFIATAMGVKKEFIDAFMQHEPKEATLEDVMSILMNASKGAKK